MFRNPFPAGPLAGPLVVGAALLWAWLAAGGRSAESPEADRFVHPLSGEAEEFQIFLDLRRAASSPAGRLLFERALRDRPGLAATTRRFAEAVGLEPLEEIRELLVWGDLPPSSSVAAPARAVEAALPSLAARLGPRLGNLEGWLLAAPGYASSRLDAETTLHSFLVVSAEPSGDAPGQRAAASEPARMWCALPYFPDENCYVVLAAFDPNTVGTLAATLRSEGFDRLRGDLGDDDVFALTLNAMPAAAVRPNQPGSGVWEAVARFRAVVASDAQRVEARAVVEAKNAEKARQISQLAAGMAAAAALAYDESPDARKQLLAELLRERIELVRPEGSSRLEARVALTTDFLERFLASPAPSARSKVASGETP
jgi:hypothetical protein